MRTTMKSKKNYETKKQDSEKKETDTRKQIARKQKRQQIQPRKKQDETLTNNDVETRKHTGLK